MTSIKGSEDVQIEKVPRINTDRKLIRTEFHEMSVGYPSQFPSPHSQTNMYYVPGSHFTTQPLFVLEILTAV